MLRWSASDISQSLANVTAGLRYYRLPVPQVMATLKDRVIFERHEGLIQGIGELTGHFDTDEFIERHGTTAIRSWRESVAMYSMQIVEHVHCLEIDFDVCNPNYGLAPAIGHLFEVLWPGRTDPQRIKRGLIKRGVIQENE